MAFWITLVRALFALILGVGLLMQPDKALPILGNFIGVFWLMTGVVSLRWGVRGEKAKGTAVLAGVIGVFAGLLMLSRWIALSYVAQDLLFIVVGVIMVLTGIIHVWNGYHSELSEHGRSWTATLLGLFEIVLGILMLVVPLEEGSLIYYAAAIWAVVGGLVIFGDALRIRRQLKTE
jgi:uncharacterized membrane protein HdeD (DUF308 family)